MSWAIRAAAPIPGTPAWPAAVVVHEVAGGLTFSSLSSNAFQNCGRTSAGAAYCWGYNEFGELGDGTITMRLGPVPVLYP